jgi:predicted PilT family ATPase
MDLAKYKKKELQQMCFDKGIILKASDNVERLVGFLNGDSTVNYTEIRCDINTVDVTKMFMSEHMDFIIESNTCPQRIFKIQDEIRGKIQRFMKTHLDYLKDVSFKKVLMSPSLCLNGSAN